MLVMRLQQSKKGKGNPIREAKATSSIQVIRYAFKYLKK